MQSAKVGVDEKMGCGVTDGADIEVLRHSISDVRSEVLLRFY